MNTENHTNPPVPTKGTPPKYAGLWLALILLLGFGLRVTGLTWGQAFCYSSQGDCQDAYRVAVNYAQGEPRAQYIGQPNFNKHAKLPGPLWAMFCAASLHLWGSIDGVVWAIILLNTAAIYLTYLLAVRTVGFPAALWAALLMAASPEAVIYSVVVFNPVVMSFFADIKVLVLCMEFSVILFIDNVESAAIILLLLLLLLLLSIPAMIIQCSNSILLIIFINNCNNKHT